MPKRIDLGGVSPVGKWEMVLISNLTDQVLALCRPSIFGYATRATSSITKGGSHVTWGSDSTIVGLLME